LIDRRTMEKSKWLLDTDILVDYLRGVPQAVKFLQKAITTSVCHISAITIAELYAGVKDGKERPILDAFIQEFTLAVIDEKTAQQGGIYKRDYGKSHGVGLADAILAATADNLDAELITLNKKHYPMLKSVSVPYKK
jgi:predicted nucleic acid-binding protein